MVLVCWVQSSAAIDSKKQVIEVRIYFQVFVSILQNYPSG